ncbi:hypothetical protein Dip518_000336 [Parelusimicrobium proximum]|uniref:hypothetical protein n=1 Tax=Parelusimicrobium proximum TaxID=3228953 RepID=UPI003D17E383
MKKSLIFMVTLLLAGFAYGQDAASVKSVSEDQISEAKQYSKMLKNKQGKKEMLKDKVEDKNIKKLKDLGEKYVSSASSQKPSVEREIKKIITEEEDKKIKEAKAELYRQEEKTKALRERVASLEKTKNDRVKENVELVKKGKTQDAIDNISGSGRGLVKPFISKAE